MSICTACDRGKQFIGKLAADRGANLRNLLHWSEPVETGHQRSLQAGGDRQRRKRLLEHELSLLLSKHPALDKH